MTGKSDVCRDCGKPLPEGHKPNRVFCGRECQKANLKKKWAEQNPKSALGAVSAGTVAEANAMRVAIDLLARGWGVYRAAFPAMPFDILAVHPIYGVGGDRDPPRQVKVVAGSKTPKGTVVHPATKVEDTDVLAVVLHDGTIVYKPEL